MKKILLFLTFILMMGGLAIAADPTQFDYTGITQEAINSPTSWYDSNGATYINGQAGQDLFGAREQVIFTQDTNISSINYNIFSSYQGPEDMSFTYNLGGVTSDPIYFSMTGNPGDIGMDQVFSGSIPFNVTVPTGTYWLTEQGTEGASLYQASQNYIDPPTQMASVATPEAPTWILFAFMLTALLFIRPRMRTT